MQVVMASGVTAVCTSDPAASPRGLCTARGRLRRATATLSSFPHQGCRSSAGESTERAGFGSQGWRGTKRCVFKGEAAEGNPRFRVSGRAPKVPRRAAGAACTPCLPALGGCNLLQRALSGRGRRWLLTRGSRGAGWRPGEQSLMAKADVARASQGAGGPGAEGQQEQC